jgi:hypothetical protein
MSERYSRNEALFGAEGQRRIRETKVAIVGLGGLGSHTAQQLAYLGVEDYGLVDFDIVTDSSLNRLVGAQDGDVEARTKKIAVANRMITSIKPEAAVDPVDARITEAGVEAVIARADIVFGCLDRDLARLQLTELCARYGRTLFDLASDVTGEDDELHYGGRVVLCDGNRCLACLALLDQREMARDSMSPDQREAHDRIYGVRKNALGDTGPMVVSINGAVASIAVTEFMALVTGLRAPFTNLWYYAERQAVRRSTDQPAPDCYYCRGIWGTASS